MVSDDERVRAALAALETTHAEVTALMQRAAELERALGAAHRDFEQHLGELYAENDRLLARREALAYALANRAAPQPPLEPSAEPPPVAPPPVVAAAPPDPLVAARHARKRALVDHIFYFLDSGEEQVMQRLNALLEDERRDVGEIVEALAWGPIWEASTPWESAEEQLARLELWRAALRERRDYWLGALSRLADDGRAQLLAERERRGPAGWAAYLDELAEAQRAENQKVARDIGALEAELRAGAAQ